MLYRFCRSLNEWYAVSVFFLYIGLFLLAVCLVFIFPPAAIFLLFFSIFALVIFRGLSMLISACERSIARNALGRGACPGCGFDLHEEQTMTEPAHGCVSCGALYAASGARITAEDQAASSRDRAEYRAT